MRVALPAHANRQTSVDEIGSAYHISKDHLFKVVQHLSRLGYVQSKSGRNGGVRLVKDPAQINVGTVVIETEGRNGVLDASVTRRPASWNRAACCGTC